MSYKKGKSIKITSVSQFVEEIARLEKEEGAEIFYRGHADESWDLLPSIFRVDKGLENEHLLFRDMVAHMPQSFSECKSALDYLVQMQHYGLPTRLLDVTINPLIALYFACSHIDDFEQVVLDAALAGASVGVDVGDTLEIGMAGAVAGALVGAGMPRALASYVTKGFIKVFYDKGKYSSGNIEELVDKATEAGVKAAEEVKGRDGVVYQFSVPPTMVKHYDSDSVSVLANLAKCEISEGCLVLSPLEAFNGQRDIKRLLELVKEEKPYFQPSICFHNLQSLFLVKAKNSNQRIINQMGAFFIFGLGELSSKGSWPCLTKEKHAEIPREWIKTRFVIPGECKEGIFAQLSQLGITDSLLFPEIATYAGELLARYGLRR